jgi:hypothetical protein
VKPATDSGVIRPPFGAKRRWSFIILPSGRNGPEFAAMDTTSYKAPFFTIQHYIMWTFLLVTLVSIIIAWWREGIGGLILTIVGLAAIVVFMLTMPPRDYWVMLIFCAPFLVSGILYLKCWRRIKSKTPQDIPNKESDATSYCPKCKAQYREGFFECSDCGVELEKFMKDFSLSKRRAT